MMTAKVSLQQYLLPVELLREIFDIYTIAETLTADDNDSESSKPNWGLFSSLTLASKTLRALALESWFRTFRVRDERDLLDENLPFPEIKSTWTRNIQFIQIHSWEDTSWSWNIEGFIKLKRVRIDCVSTRIGITPAFPFTGPLSSIVEADIRGIYWPSPLVVQCISQNFPMLRVLRMQQTRVWCGLCHTCCIPSFEEPEPKVIRYEDGNGLPSHYSQAFTSLSNLEAVYLTVGVLQSGTTTLGNEEGKNQNLWSGECDRCMRILYDDETFKLDWVAKKRNLAMNPPRLSVVEWRFLSKQESELMEWDDDDEDDEELEEEVGEEAERESAGDLEDQEELQEATLAGIINE